MLSYAQAYDPITIYKGNLRRICPTNPDFLSDNVIDFKIRHIMSELEGHVRNKIHVFSCLFYSKLCEADKDPASHALVARWTKNVNLFEKEYVLVPVNMSYHWSLTVIVRPGLLLVCKAAFPILSSLPTHYLLLCNPTLTGAELTPF